MLHETNGELITTTTNSMTVRVYRRYYYSTTFTLLITVQKGKLCFKINNFRRPEVHLKGDCKLVTITASYEFLQDLGKNRY